MTLIFNDFFSSNPSVFHLSVLDDFNHRNPSTSIKIDLHPESFLSVVFGSRLLDPFTLQQTDLI